MTTNLSVDNLTFRANEKDPTASWQWGVVALALVYWTRFPVPPLSASRELRLPIGDTLADDPGLYWATGPLMRLTGLDVFHAVWLLALAAFAVAVLAQRDPLSRFLLIVTAPMFIAPGGPYWIPAVAMWLALPASPRMSGLVGVLVTPFRAAAGLPALAWAFRSWRVGLVSLVAVAVVSLVGSHVLWHSIYIGLGWYPNPWGITYADASGMAATTAAYASPEYEAALRSLVIAHVLEQPGWFVAQLVAKAGEAVSLAMPWVLLVPLALIRRPALAIPLGLAFAPLLVAPMPAYATGWVAGCVVALRAGRHLEVDRRADEATDDERRPAVHAERELVGVAPG